ncbi:MAG TPA: glycosyl hydrolase family 28-related protein [Candidatus Saccharimonadales bacterium]
MARLPLVGGDNGDWGDVLNQFLGISHDADGSLSSSAVSAAGAYFKPVAGIPESDLTLATQTNISLGGTSLQPSSVGAASGVASLDSSGLIPASQFGNTVAAPLEDKGGQVYNVKAYGATGNGTTDDTAAIKAALAAASSNNSVYVGGGTVFVPAGTYKVSSPIIIPPGVTLQGSTRTFWFPNEGGTTNGVMAPASRIMPSASFNNVVVVNNKYTNNQNTNVTVNGVIALVETATGGYVLGSNPIASGNQTIANITVDGSNLPGGNTLDAFIAYGSVMGVTMTNCGATNVGGHGIESAYAAVTGEGYGFLNEIDMSHCVFYNCGGDGVHLVAASDSTFTACHVIACTGNAWYLDQVGNARFLGCKGEWSNIGWYVTWPSGFNNQPRMTFVGCSTDYNTTDGFYLDGNQTGGFVLLSGCDFHADGSASSSTAAGLHISGAAYPIIVTGCGVMTGPTHSGANAYSPAIGIKIDSTPTLVSIENSYFQGLTSAWATDGTGTVITGLGVQTSTGGTPVAPTAATAKVTMATGGLQLNGASTTYSGSGAPSSALGANGDYYFRSDTPGTANQRMYVKVAGAWTGIV